MESMYIVTVRQTPDIGSTKNHNITILEGVARLEKESKIYLSRKSVDNVEKNFSLRIYFIIHVSQTIMVYI